MMSALIKSGESDAVRRFEQPRPLAIAAEPEPKIDPRDARIARLEADLADHRDALATAERDAKTAIADAYEKGMAAGLASANDQALDRVEALRAALHQADDQFDAALTALERLAPALARAALNKLFGAVDDWAPMVDAMLAHQLATLRRASVISVSVSAEDFADPGTVASLASDTYRGVIDPALPAGAARIDCKIGQIDLDVRTQWQSIAQLLDEMAL